MCIIDNDWVIPLTIGNDWVIPLTPYNPLSETKNFTFYRPWTTVDKNDSRDIPSDPKKLYKRTDLWNRLEEEEDDE